MLAVQAPLPSQRPRGVSLPSTHDASPQSVSGPDAKPAHLVRSFDGSQVSVLHASPAPSKHFVRAPCGAPVMPEQVPSAPGTSHASHCPVHTESQQTPSMQKPVVHSFLLVQAEPFVFTQVPTTSGVDVSAHTVPAPQASTVQQTFLPPGPPVQKPLLHCVPSEQSEPSSPVVTQTPPVHA